MERGGEYKGTGDGSNREGRENREEMMKVKKKGRKVGINREGRKEAERDRKR